MEPRKPIIAVVDDEEAIRKALRRLLLTMNVDVGVFPTGEAFIESLREASPDCLVLDLHMPGLSGLEVLQRLREAQVRFPTVIITAYDEPRLKEQCMAAGATAYLRKPLDSDVLLAAISGSILQKS